MPGFSLICCQKPPTENALHLLSAVNYSAVYAQPHVRNAIRLPAYKSTFPSMLATNDKICILVLITNEYDRQGCFKVIS